MISLWGDKGGDTENLLRDLHQSILDKTEGFTGVEFTEVVWLDYEDPEFDKEKIAFSREDPAFLVVINGLQSKEDWDEIKATVVPEGTKSCTIIIAKEEDVADYCKDERPREIDQVQREANAAVRPFTKVLCSVKY